MSFKPVKPREYGTTKDVVSRLIAEAGGAKRAAHLIGLSATQVYAYSDPQEPDQITLDNVRRLVEASGSSAPAEDFSGLAGGFFTAVEASNESFAALMAREEREHGKAMASIVERLGWHDNGALKPPERAKLAREIDGMIRALVAARRKLEDGAQ